MRSSRASASANNLRARNAGRRNPAAKTIAANSPYYVLALLFFVNLLNYVDRHSMYAFLPMIEKELGLSDALAGSLASAFMLMYMTASLPIASLADRQGRPRWMGIGLGLWSMATAGASQASRYATLLAARAGVGIGESCYVAASPSFVAEHFAPGKRGLVLGLFLMTIPLGAAIGYMAGGTIAQAFGWRWAFVCLGLPGLFLVWPLLRLQDPRLGEFKRAAQGRNAVGGVRAFLDLFTVPSYVAATLSTAALTFVLGGFGVWVPTFFHRTWGLNVGQAGMLLGSCTAVAGTFGTFAGGWLSDWLEGRCRAPYFVVAGVSVLIGAPLAVLALCLHRLLFAFVLFFISDLFLFMHLSPLNAAIVAVTEPRRRTVAFAANIFVIHLLGDAISPTIIGFLSDRWGLRRALLVACLGFVAAAASSLAAIASYGRDARYA